MTITRRHAAVLGVALLASTITSAAPGQHRNFVACPIVRDTSTVPCWLAEYEGELYFLTLQTDVSAPVNPPQLGHQVLVEGVVADEPRVCGGIPLEAGRALGAARAGQLLFDHAAGRGSLQPHVRAAASARPEPRAAGVRQSPRRRRLVRPPRPTALPKAFTLQYDFDSTVAFRHAGALQQIQEAVQKGKATHVDITAYRASSLLSNGKTLVERDDIGRRRAEQLAGLLKDAGLTSVAYQVRWQDAPAPDGQNDAAARRAEIVVRRN